MSNRKFAAALLEGGYSEEEQMKSIVKLIASNVGEILGMDDVDFGRDVNVSQRYSAEMIQHLADDFFKSLSPELEKKYRLRAFIEQDFVTMTYQVVIGHEKKRIFRSFDISDVAFINREDGVANPSFDFESISIDNARIENLGIDPVIRTGTITAQTIRNMGEWAEASTTIEFNPTSIEFMNGSRIEAMVSESVERAIRAETIDLGPISPEILRAQEALSEARDSERLNRYRMMYAPLPD